MLSEPEAIALIKVCSHRAPTGIRNRALIAVLWRCGLRISEALALELRDVGLQAGTLRVRHGKGDKSRTVGVDEQTAALLAPAGSTAAGPFALALARRCSPLCKALLYPLAAAPLTASGIPTPQSPPANTRRAT